MISPQIYGNFYHNIIHIEFRKTCNNYRISWAIHLNNDTDFGGFSPLCRVGQQHNTLSSATNAYIQYLDKAIANFPSS